MRRRILLACAIAMPLGALNPAAAEVPVIDMSAITQMVNQIKWLKDQYQEMTQQLAAITDGIDLTQVAPGLLTQGIQNPLGAISGQIPNLVSGLTSGNIQGSQQFLNADRYYQPQGGDFMAQAMNGLAVSLANMKAVSMQMIGANQQRIDQLNGLQNDLIGAQDISQVERINGRISLENQTLAAQQAQATQVIQMTRLQEQVQNERIQQRIRSDDDAQINDTTPTTVGGQGITQPDTTTFVGG